jgi:hypothetical protein
MTTVKPAAHHLPGEVGDRRGDAGISAMTMTAGPRPAGPAYVPSGRRCLGEVGQGAFMEGSFPDRRRRRTETALSSTTPFCFAIQATSPPGTSGEGGPGPLAELV